MEKSKVIRSLIYKFTERFAAKLIGFVIQILLARLLAPELFGQVVLLQTVIDFFVLVIENGVNTSLIQSPKVSERDYFTVFVITLALTGATFLVMQAAAPLLADFYRSPGLTAPMRFYALSLLFSGFNSIQTARMQREMRFREMMFCNLSATVLAGTLGVVLAWRGAGIWALVGYSFAYIVFVCIFTFLVQRWVPHGGFSKESARRLGGDVTIVYRRTKAELPARAEEVEHAIEEGIKFAFLTNPAKINGDENGNVKSITCIKMELGEPDASGRRRPVEIPNSEFDIDVDEVIMALGTSPNPLIKSTTEGLETERWGGIIANEETGKTSRDHVYAGGDAVTGAATVILAMGAGKKAAAAIAKELLGE